MSFAPQFRSKYTLLKFEIFHLTVKFTGYILALKFYTLKPIWCLVVWSEVSFKTDHVTQPISTNRYGVDDGSSITSYIELRKLERK